MTYLYADVTGRILTGTAVPEPAKPVPPSSPPAADSDRDTVPDALDPMPFDFNNDGVPDAQTSGDYDGDGLIDYGLPGGTDYWLNTTLPNTFPAPYAGRFVSVYIGPTNRPPLLGEDVLRMFLDMDNSTFSGYAIGGVGADRLVEIRGKDGTVTQSALLAFSGSFPGEWSWTAVSPVTVALGYHAIELSIPLNATNLYVESGDFWGSTDSTTSVPALVRQLSSFDVAASTSPLSVPWAQVGPQPTTVIDPGSNAVTTNYNQQRKVVRAGDVAGQTACDATNSDGCWYVVFYDQLAETTDSAPSTETITTGSKVSGTFPTDVQTSNNAYIQYREANQAPLVDHTFVEVTAVQSTTSTTYVDIPGATIGSSSFTAGRKYLLVFTAQVASPLSSLRNAYIQTLHGTTVFPGSEFSFRTVDNPARYTYYWFTVWTAVSGEGVKLQHHIEGNTVRVDTDQITMFKLDLGDLTENTDWSFNENTAGDTIGFAGPNWDGLASVTFTPPAASDWLVMATMRGDPDSTSVEYASRIARSGEAVEGQPLTQWGGRDATLDRYVQTLARVYSLTTASNTFTQESRCSSGCSYPRTYSSVFALNLNKFEDRASVWTEAPIDLSTTDFATQIQTLSLTPTRTADVWIVGQTAVDVDATANYHKFRLQVDNVDQPGTQTSDAYIQWENFDAIDEVLSAIQTVENLGATAHAFDLDASREGTTATAEDRVIFAVSLVLKNYQMEVRYDWSGIAAGSSAYVLKAEAHHTAGEDFLVRVLTPPSTWNTRITITKTADDNAVQTYTLTTAEFNAGAPAIRFVGNAEASDSSQSDLYLDYVTVSPTSFWDRIVLMRSSDTSGSTWGSQIILASGRTGDSALLLARDSSEPSIAIDSAGFLHVVWVAASAAGDQSTLNLVRFTKTTVAYPTQSDLANAANWQAVTNVDDTDTGSMPTVSTDTSNNPHVGWSGSKTSGTVYYKNKAGGTWRSTVSWGSTYTGLSVDVSPQNNYVSIARYDAGSSEIHYTVCKDLSTSNCDASGEFTKWDGSAGVDTVDTATSTATVQSVTPTSFPTDSTTHNVQMPATVNSGDLLMVFISSDGTPDFTTPSGWTGFFFWNSWAGSGNKFSMWAKRSDGTEGGTTVNWATNVAEKAAAQVYRITGWRDSGTITNDIEWANAGATSTTPDPPSLNPVNWDVEGTLWIASYGAEDNDDLTSYPTGYSGGTFTKSDAALSTTSTSMASAWRNLAAASEDPGTFTTAASKFWIASTVAVRPAVLPSSPMFPTIAHSYESNGDVWVAYAKVIGSTTTAIYARFLDFPSGGWQTEEVVALTSGTVFARPSIGIDVNNDVHALYVDASAPQLYYEKRTGGSWGAATAVDASSDNPTLVVRAPNNLVYGTDVGALYWKTTSSETYFFHIPEFESVALPVLGSILLGVVFRRRARRHGGSLSRHRRAAPASPHDEGDVPRQ